MKHTPKKLTTPLEEKLNLLIDLAEMYGQDSSQAEKWAWFARRSREGAWSLLIAEMQNLEARIAAAKKTWNPEAQTI